MAQIKNIIFDFDGTLVDTAPLIIKSMQETIRRLGLPSKTIEECRATIGLRLQEIPNVLWPELSDIGDKYATNYRIIFDQLKRPLNVNCFPDVTDVLRQLHDAHFNMAIASSRGRKSIEEYIDQFGLNGCFSMLVGGEDVANGKPAPDPVLKITDTLGWDVSETLTVGDASVDILMGKAAGTKTCAVSYGNGTLSELIPANPDYIISKFKDIIPIVNR